MAGTDMGIGGDVARCAMHPSLAARGTCARCGNFMCEVCSEDGARKLCPVCRERTGQEASFPLERHSWSIGALWEYCFEAFKREWLMLSVAMLVVMVVSIVAQAAGNIASTIAGLTDSVALIVLAGLFAFVVQTVVQGVMGMGMLRVVFDVLEGGRADVSRLFSQVHKAWRYLGTTLLLVLVLGVPLMLLFGLLLVIGMLGVGVPVGVLAGEEVFRPEGPLMAALFVGAGLLTLIPGLYFGLPFYLVQAHLAFTEEETPMGALRHCYLLARGQRLPLFGVLLLMAPVVFVGVLACCVGVLPALALSQLLLGGVYLALRRGSVLEARPR